MKVVPSLGRKPTKCNKIMLTSLALLKKKGIKLFKLDGEYATQNLAITVYGHFEASTFFSP